MSRHKFKFKLEAESIGSCREEALAELYRRLNSDIYGFLWTVDGQERRVSNGKFCNPCRGDKVQAEPSADDLHDASAAEHAASELQAKGHKHAALMAEYAKDATQSTTPWRGWEYRTLSRSWEPHVTHPGWSVDSEYRRKPKTFTLNGVEVPMPLNTYKNFAEVQKGPGRCLYMLNLFSQKDPEVVNPSMFYVEDLFNAGFLHETREAAIAHAKAILAGGVK